MKKTLLIALMLIPFLGLAQTTKPIDGVLGIKFGTSKAEALKALKTKTGVLFTSEDEDIYHRKIMLGHREADQLRISFTSDKLYYGEYLFKPENNQVSVDYYNSLVSDLTGIYGKGTSYRKFKSPYDDGDGHEVLAILGSYADITTSWEDDKKSIYISYRVIDDEIFVRLEYTDDVLNAEATAKQKQKEKSDF